MWNQGYDLKPRFRVNAYFHIYNNNKNLIPEPTAQSAVPGVSPGRGLLIPHFTPGYLHPVKREHSEVQSRPTSRIADA